MATVSQFAAAHLEAICGVLGDTGNGLTGSEITRILSAVGVQDTSVSSTKRHRLFEALSARQNQDRCGNGIVAFIHAAMDPARYTQARAAFTWRRDALNPVLAFAGYTLGDDGKLRVGSEATTLDQAEERAGRLRAELRRRQVHPDVLAFCRAELLQQNYFHAVFEATKSVADKIRRLAGIEGDGSTLVDDAFRFRGVVPLLAFNRLVTEAEQSEQSGLMNLIKGMFGTFRNVTAHTPKISWEVTEQDAFDLLTIASLLHRRLDLAIRTPRIP